MSLLSTFVVTTRSGSQVPFESFCSMREIAQQIADGTRIIDEAFKANLPEPNPIMLLGAPQNITEEDTPENGFLKQLGIIVRYWDICSITLQTDDDDDDDAAESTNEGGTEPESRRFDFLETMIAKHE